MFIVSYADLDYHDTAVSEDVGVNSGNFCLEREVGFAAPSNRSQPRRATEPCLESFGSRITIRYRHVDLQPSPKHTTSSRVRINDDDIPIIWINTIPLFTILLCFVHSQPEFSTAHLLLSGKMSTHHSSTDPVRLIQLSAPSKPT